MKINYLKLLLVFICLLSSCKEKNILSLEEEKWLLNNPNLKVSVYGYIPPYLFNNKEGVSDGVFIDYINLIEKKINYTFDKIEYDSWPELYNDALEEKIHIILDIPKTKERQIYFDFYGDFFKSNYVIVCQQNKSISFKNLATASIIVPENYAIIETVKKSFPNAKIETLPKEHDCLTALSEGKYDAYLSPQLVANYFIHELNITNLKISEVTPFGYEPKISVLKKNPQLSSIIAKAVRDISMDEKDTILKNWLYNEIEPFYRQLDFWLLLIGILLIIIIAIITFNRVLKKIIRKRTSLLQEAINKSNRSNEVKNRFIQNISHEIRTPMNSILGFSELLSKDGLSKEEQLKYIDNINSSGKRLIQVIDSILDISNFGTSEIEINYQQVNLSLLIKEVENTFKKIAEDKNISLKFHTAILTTDVFVIDKNATLKIYENLIDNALKFTNKGGVDVYTHFSNNKLEIKVVDTGKGIDNEDKEAIFEMFSINDLNTPVLDNGLGLGLTIVKENVKALKGELSFDSEVMKGSSFKVSLPVTKTTLDTTTKNSIDKNYTILIVEDAKVNFLLIKSILKQLKEYNLTILHAENGQLAVEMCDNYSEIDLIIMDIRMPVMNGYRATQLIKSKYPNYNIIAHTAHSSDGDIKKALEVGCETVLGKPVEIDLFKETIIKYLKSAHN